MTIDRDVVVTRRALMRDLLADLDLIGDPRAAELEEDRIRRHAVERILGHLVDLAEQRCTVMAAAPPAGRPRVGQWGPRGRWLDRRVTAVNAARFLRCNAGDAWISNVRRNLAAFAAVTRGAGQSPMNCATPTNRAGPTSPRSADQPRAAPTDPRVACDLRPYADPCPAR